MKRLSWLPMLRFFFQGHFSNRTSGARKRKRSTAGTLERLEQRRLLSGESLLQPAILSDEIAPGIFIQRSRIETLGDVDDAVRDEPIHFVSQLNGSGLQFNFTAASGMSQVAIDGFVAAANLWSAIFTDDIVVNIDIDFTALGPGILGSTGSSDITTTYSAFRTALISDATSTSDLSAVASLQNTSAPAMLLNRTSNSPNGSGSATPFLDNDGDANNTTISITRANAKAAGVLSANSSVSDASITFSSLFTWDFDRSNGISSGAFDFVGVAAHEIGHALGFVSGVDILDGNSPPSGGPFPDSAFVFVAPIDLFRFSSTSVSNGQGVFDWTADNRTKFFSIDGGTTQLATFSTGVDFGDGSQASHWKDNLNIGIMDPTAAPGEYTDVTNLDVQGFDVIGWNVSMDFGDGPDVAAGTTTGDYRTTLSDNGPRHALFSASGSISDTTGAPKVFLGASVTRELSAQQNSGATGDADNGIASFPALNTGTTANVTVTSTGGGAILNYFFDFNTDGDFLDSGESFSATLNSTSQTVPVVIPAGATTGSTLARFRISTAGGLTSVGPAADGEVEDYLVNIASSASTNKVTIAKIADGIEANSPTDGQFRVSLTTSSPTDTVVNYSIGGTAIPGAGNDYTTLTGSVTILAGQTFANINVAVLNDAIVESTETIVLTLTSLGAHDASIALDSVAANLTATVDITDSDTATVSIAKITDGVESATPTNAKFRVTQTAVSSTNTVVNYTVTGTATSGSGHDFNTLSGSVTILAGQTTADIDATILNDAVVEATETIVVTLSTLGTHDADISLSGTPANLTATADITDNDTATVSIAKITDGAETNSPTNGKFRVTQTAVSSSATVVTYLISGTAVAGAGNDYTSLSGTVTILAGQTTADIEVSILNDAVIEVTETVVLTLNGLGTHDSDIALNGTPANLTATMNLTDNDTATVSIAKLIDGAEAATPVNGRFRVTQSAVSATDTTVNYSINGTAALRSGDFSVLAGSVTIPPGQTSADIDVFVIDDSVVEGLETVIIALSGFGAHDADITLNVTPANLTATMTITDNDTATVSIAKVTNGAEGSTPANGQFQVIQTATSTTNTIVHYSVSGTAGAGTDYTTLSGTVTIPAGQTTAVIDVSVLDNLIVEGTETVVVTLTTLTGQDPDIALDATPANLTATVDILDNDTATFTINDVNVSEGAGNLTFDLTTSRALDIDVTVFVTFQDGTAAGGGVDYASGTQMFVFFAGQTSQTVSLAVVNDGLVETSETFLAQLSTSTLLGTRSVDLNDVGTGTINDNDSATVSIAKSLDGAETTAPMAGRFTVTQTAPSSTDTVVIYSVGGTATPGAGNDYSTLSGSVTIPAGLTSATIDVTVLADAIVEGTETVALTLTSFGTHDADIALNATPANRTATVNVSDDDTTTLTISSPTVAESNGVSVLSFNVMSLLAVQGGFTVDYVIENISTDTGDYVVGTFSPLAFSGAANESHTIVLNVSDDNVVETTETLRVTLGTVVSVVPAVAASILTGAVGTGTITDTDTATVSITKIADGVEADSPTNGIFRVIQTAPSSTDTVVSYSVGGSAIAGVGDDYSTLSGTVTIRAGQTFADIDVTVLNDTIVEVAESVTVTLANLGVHDSEISLNGTLANLTANVNIADTDTTTLAVTSPVVTEGNNGSATMTFTVTSPNAVDGGFSVAFTTANVTSANDDYSVVSSSPLTFAGTANEAHTITVTIFGDVLVEGDEQFAITLGTVIPVIPSLAASIITGAVGTGTISNDDTNTLTIDSQTLVEGDGGAKTMTFTVTSTNAVQGGFAVAFNVSNFSTSDSDYTLATNSPLSFTGVANETRTITVNVVGDSIVETDEQLRVTLGAVVPAAPVAAASILTGAVGTGTINNDDSNALVISSPTVMEGDSGLTVLTFVVTSPNPVQGGFLVAYNLAHNTTTNVDASLATVSPLAFTGNANESRSITVNVVGDMVVERSETLSILLGAIAATDAVIASNIGTGALGTGTISDDDTATFTINDVTVSEGVGSLNFTLTTDKPLDTDVTIDVSLSNGTATGGGIDFSSIPQQVTFAAGQTVQTVGVVINNDSLLEGTENFVATLSSSTPLGGRSVLVNDAGTGTINDNDTATVSIVKIADGAETETPTPGAFRITQSGVSSTDTVITYTVGGTATFGSGQDYTALTGTVTIPAGQTTVDIDVTVLNDDLVESTETVLATLSGFGSHDPDVTLNPTPANVTAVLNISDSDLPTLSLVDAATVVENTPTAVIVADAGSDASLVPNHQLTFSLSGPDATLFDIDSQTGEIAFRESPDFEAPADQGGDNGYRVTVTVTADVSPGKSSSKDLTINVTGLNDLEPVFVNASPTFSIPENSALGTVVGNVPATDADLAPQSLTYSIVSGNPSGTFTINPATGQIAIANSGALNFEETTEFSLLVRVTDNGSPTPLTDDAVVVVNLTNVVEGPTIIGPTSPGTYHPSRIRGELIPNADFTYGDVANPSFDGAQLKVSIVSGRTRADQLSIFKKGDTAGQISVKGHNIFAGTQLIGTFTGGKGKTPDLVITLNASVNGTIVKALLARLNFLTRGTIGTQRTINVQLTEIGGKNSNVATRQIDIV